MTSMFFNSWHDIGRTILVGALAYSGLILILRVSGKRTLSKMNAFDLIVTVALGSILASALLSKDVALAESLAAFATLIGLQFIVAWLCVRFKPISNLVKAEPSLLFHRGEFCSQNMRRERVVEAEVRSAVRAQGIASLEEIEAVVLETDGSFTVIKPSGKPASALQFVEEN